MLSDSLSVEKPNDVPFVEKKYTFITQITNLIGIKFEYLRQIRKDQSSHIFYNVINYLFGFSTCQKY